jgi:hypothetical protein
MRPSQFPGVKWKLTAHLLTTDGSGRKAEQQFFSSEAST